jgi:uncharacterized membrane protein YbhN (UPF0104 family)
MGAPDAPLDARLARHRELLSAFAVCLGVGGVALVSAWAGWHDVAKAFGALDPVWLIVIVALVPAALAGYTGSYRATIALGGGPELGPRTAVLIVTAGFGAFAVAGGFLMDQRILCSLGLDKGSGRRIVIGLGALEYAVLAPAACAAAVVLLAAGGENIESVLLWSWALAVPIGFAFGLWAASPSHRERIRPTSRARSALRQALEGVGLLLVTARHPLRHAAAWAGMAVYWAAEIATLYAAGRLFGVTLGVAHAVLAYATGYALTRRSMPLGGAGVTEILMALALHWVGVPLASTVPIVVAYRAANLLLLVIPAARSHVRLGHLPSGSGAQAR